MEPLRDEELVQKCLAGDKDAFAVILSRYEKPVFSLAYRLCGDYNEAADLAQEAFLQIYRGLAQFDASKKFFPWMYRVAHNTCVNVIQRKPSNQVPLEEMPEISFTEVKTDEQPEAYYDNRELRSNIDGAIEELPEKYREVIVLRFMVGLSYQEIADKVGVTLSAVETRIYRGRQLLQKKLQPFVKG